MIEHKDFNIEEQLSKIRVIAEYQDRKAVYSLFDISPMYGFVFDEVFIHNPFLDDCGMGEINPFKYYGEAFTYSNFFQIKEDINKYKNTEIIAYCDGEVVFEGWSYDFLDLNEFQAEVEEKIFKVIEKGVVINKTISGEWIIYKREE